MPGSRRICLSVSLLEFTKEYGIQEEHMIELAVIVDVAVLAIGLLNSFWVLKFPE